MQNDLFQDVWKSLVRPTISGLFKIELLKVKPLKVQTPKPPAESNLQLGRTVAEPTLKFCVVNAKQCSQIHVFIPFFNHFPHDLSLFCQKPGQSIDYPAKAWLRHWSTFQVGQCCCSSSSTPSTATGLRQRCRQQHRRCIGYGYFVHHGSVRAT